MEGLIFGILRYLYKIWLAAPIGWQRNKIYYTLSAIDQKCTRHEIYQETLIF